MTYGACFGDVAGAPYEYTGSEPKMDSIELSSSSFDFTDDSVLTCVVADYLVGHSHDEESSFISGLSQAFADAVIAYPGAGWGSRFNAWSHGDDRSPYQSYGNGSAMRASPVAWWFDDEQSVLDAARLTAMPTHDHIEGIRGAQAIALAVFLARKGADKNTIRNTVIEAISGDGVYPYNVSRSVDDIISSGYRFEVSCQKSVPEALCAFLDESSVDYESTIRNTLRLGGDADTQCAMTGAIAEAMWGMPKRFLDDERTRLHRAGLDVRMDAFVYHCEPYRRSLSLRS
jgi:ADP-ribosylglycohydrolase